MSDKLDKINKALVSNARPLVPIQKEVNLTDDAEEDYNLARDNLKSLLDKSDEALDHLSLIHI